jgi:hypothetical protein
MADVARAWRLADTASKTAIHRGEPAASIGRELRYALITTSVNSLATTFPAGLLPALVRTGLWRPEQAVAYARRTPGPAERYEALTLLTDVLRDAPMRRTLVLAEALEVARTIQDVGRWCP